jgi:hypothetical protein
MDEINRNLRVERTYALGNYINIKFTDEINNLPEKFITDPKALDTIRYLQFIQTELNYRRYIILANNLQIMEKEQAIEELEKLRTDTINDIKTLLTNGDLKE